MTDPERPRDPDDLALARVLDGLDVPDDADPAALAAHERAVADVDAIARALGLIGDTLGAEPIAEETVVAPASGVVVPLRRRPSWAPLAAAASIVAVLGVGTVVVLNHDGGPGSSSTAAQGPAHRVAAPDAAMAPMQGQSMMAVPAPAAPAAAPAAAAPAAPTGESSSGAAAKAAKAAPSASSFVAAVGCARGILLGKVVSITGSSGQYKLVLQVIEWISSGSGASVTYQVGSESAVDDSGSHRLTVGQQRVFIVPQDPGAQIRAYVDSTSLRGRIATAQQQTSGQACG